MQLSIAVTSWKTIGRNKRHNSTTYQRDLNERASLVNQALAAECERNRERCRVLTLITLAKACCCSSTFSISSPEALSLHQKKKLR